MNILKIGKINTVGFAVFSYDSTTGSTESIIINLFTLSVIVTPFIASFNSTNYWLLKGPPYFNFFFIFDFIS